jgi:hypothetical protein
MTVRRIDFFTWCSPFYHLSCHLPYSVTEIVRKMVTINRGNHAKRVMVAHIAGSHPIPGAPPVILTYQVIVMPVKDL